MTHCFLDVLREGESLLCTGEFSPQVRRKLFVKIRPDLHSPTSGTYILQKVFCRVNRIFRFRPTSCQTASSCGGSPVSSQ